MIMMQSRARILGASLSEPHSNQYCEKSDKAGQTKFTVYRHRFFDFACGRAVIQISN